MLLAHFTLHETDACPEDPVSTPGVLMMAQAQVEMATDIARKNMYDELLGRPGTPWQGKGVSTYDADGGMPFTQTYVGEWQVNGGLDCASAWGEPYCGEGVHVGLVIEGKATGPLYWEPGIISAGVNHNDIDHVIVGTFARHLHHALKESLGWFDLDRHYYVTDWAFYERVSAQLTLTFEREADHNPTYGS